MKSLSVVRLLATLWTAASQAPLFLGVSRQEYWSGVPLPSLGVSNYYWLYITGEETDPEQEHPLCAIQWRAGLGLEFSGLRVESELAATAAAAAL